jgi:N-terminal domain on NACHT_NTPase and P-loop NTPases
VRKPRAFDRASLLVDAGDKLSLKVLAHLSNRIKLKHIFYRIMAEVLFVTSLVSSIVQLVDFGVKVIDRLNEFQSSINDVPKTFCDIKNQLPLLIDALGRTQSQAEAGDVSEKTAEALKPVVSGCLSQVKLLDDIIVKAIPAENASTWNRSFKALSSLAHDKKVQQITSTLEGYVQKLIYHQVTNGLDQIRLLVREPSQKWKFKTPLFMVKFDRDLNFIGREDVLKEIDERHKMQRRRVAIAGIGGVG